MKRGGPPRIAAPARRRSLLLVMLAFRPLWAAGIGAWLRSSGSVIRHGWVLSPDD